MIQLLQALRIRAFGFLWTGQTVSRLGDGLFNIAIAWWVLDKTGSAVALGLVEVFAIVPKLIFLLIGGVIADRLPRLRVMLTSDTIRGVLLVIVAVLTVTNRLAVWHLYVAAFIFGFVDAFFQPAYAAVVPEVVPADKLPSANGLTAMSGQFAGIFGPSIGGVIVAAGGSALAFGLDAVSFFVAAACVLPIFGHIAARVREPDAPPTSIVSELREGIKAVRKSPFLWVTILAAAFANIFLAGSIAVALPTLVKVTLKGSAEDYGTVLTIFSVGAIVGSILVGRAGKVKRRSALMYGFWIMSGLTLASLAFVHAVWAVAATAFLVGICIFVGTLFWTNILQEIVPPELLGRVSSVDQFGSFILLPVSYGFTGVVVSAIGAPLTFVICGLLGAGIFSLGLLHPEVRNLD